MSCCGGTDEGSKQSREVERQLRVDRQKLDGEIKLLLLGLYTYPRFLFSPYTQNNATNFPILLYTKELERAERAHLPNK